MSELLIYKIISELADELKKIFPDFLGLYLYGSYARGDHNVESDYDLALIFDNEKHWKEKHRIQDIVASFDVKYLVFLDAWIFSKADIAKQNTPLRESIVKEGIYYAA